MTSERSIVPVAVDIVRPAVTPQQALDAWAEYQAMKKALATPDDVQTIQGRDFLKKSYWRKVERFYKLSLALLSESHEDTPQGRVFYAMYRASHPSGAFADGDGSDYATEIMEYHNARATAHTRAKNRAIADLVGGGEVSAEEVSGSRQPDQSAHYCEKHKANWFKRGKMPSFAHPVDGGGWCNEPKAAPVVVDAETVPPQDEGLFPPQDEGLFPPKPFDRQAFMAQLQEIAPGLNTPGQVAASVSAFVGRPWKALEALGVDGLIAAIKERQVAMKAAPQDKEPA